MHPDDAVERNIATGQRAVISGGTAQIVAAVETSTEMMLGCVSLPHGWGHDLSGVDMGVARDQPGVSINDVTDDSRLDPLSGNAALSGVLVHVALSPT
jgi:anaerobic selenocysteine-containing dehydrogenase